MGEIPTGTKAMFRGQEWTVAFYNMPDDTYGLTRTFEVDGHIEKEGICVTAEALLGAAAGKPIEDTDPYQSMATMLAKQGIDVEGNAPVQNMLKAMADQIAVMSKNFDFQSLDDMGRLAARRQAERKSLENAATQAGITVDSVDDFIHKYGTVDAWLQEPPQHPNSRGGVGVEFFFDGVRAGEWDSYKPRHEPPPRVVTGNLKRSITHVVKDYHKVDQDPKVSGLHVVYVPIMDDDDVEYSVFGILDPGGTQRHARIAEPCKTLQACWDFCDYLIDDERGKAVSIKSGTVVIYGLDGDRWIRIRDDAPPVPQGL